MREGRSTIDTDSFRMYYKFHVQITILSIQVRDPARSSRIWLLCSQSTHRGLTSPSPACQVLGHLALLRLVVRRLVHVEVDAAPVLAALVNSGALAHGHLGFAPVRESEDDRSLTDGALDAIRSQREVMIERKFSRFSCALSFVLMSQSSDTAELPVRRSLWPYN